MYSKVLGISFPQAPQYNIRAVSNFFENSQRYLQLNAPVSLTPVEWEKSSIIFLFGHLLVIRVNKLINFFLQAQFKVSAVWYCSHFLQLVSLTPATNLLPLSLTPVAKLQTCNRYQHHHQYRCSWFQWCALTCEYLHEFMKKFEMSLVCKTEYCKSYQSFLTSVGEKFLINFPEGVLVDCSPRALLGCIDNF